MSKKIYNTIHIFSFGVVQVIGKDFNYVANISEVQSEAEACVISIYNNKPSDVSTEFVYHAINIFEGMFVDWLSGLKEDKSFRINFSNSEIDVSVFNTLAQALIDLKSTQTI
jgi:hypothetical protein